MHRWACHACHCARDYFLDNQRTNRFQNKVDCRCGGVQLEELFRAPQRAAKAGAAAKQAHAPPGKQLAVLDLKRATAVGVRMSRLTCDQHHTTRFTHMACKHVCWHIHARMLFILPYSNSIPRTNPHEQAMLLARSPDCHHATFCTTESMQGGLWWRSLGHACDSAPSAPLHNMRACNAK